jgi:hypothetical protein
VESGRATEKQRANERARALERAGRQRERTSEKAPALARTMAALRERSSEPGSMLASSAGGRDRIAAPAAEGYSTTTAVSIILALAGIGAVLLLVSLVPSHVFVGASRVVRSRLLADLSYQLASSRGEVAILGLSVLGALAGAFLIVFLGP